MNSDHGIKFVVSRPRLRIGQASNENLSPPLKPTGKTVTFVELVETKSQSSVSSPAHTEHTEPNGTTVFFTSHDPDSDDTADNDLANHRRSIEERSHGHLLHRPHLFHHNDYPTALANRLSSAIRSAVQDPSDKHHNRRFISTDQLGRILEKRAIEKVLESFIPQTEQHTENHHPRKSLSVSSLWRRFTTSDDVDPQSTSTHRYRSYVSGLADDICNEHRKTFATLLLINNSKAILKFIRAGLTDAHLPLHSISFTREDGTSPDDVLCAKDHLAHLPPIPCGNCLRWSVSWIRLFEDKQWEMLAPVFQAKEDEAPNHYTLHDQIILPFTYCQHACRGSRGEILKVRIHANHHNFHHFDTSADPDSFFAVKKLAEQEELGRERSVLKRIDDQHVITLLATYEHRGYYHLVMPWAECNLEAFWAEKMPDPPRDSKVLHWMARQCLGTAKGLGKVQHHLTNSVSSLHGSSLPIPQRSARAPRLSIPVPKPSTALSASKKLRVYTRHTFFGRHGDIKPQNLLWFPDTTDLGIVKITDFGEGEFNKSQSARRSTDSISYTPSYRPPECDDPTGEIEMQSATFDTWSLGCLYLEFITWYIGGWKFVLEFDKSRHAGADANIPSDCRRPSPFFETTGLTPPAPHARIKPAVIEVRPFPFVETLIQHTPVSPVHVI